MAIFKKVLMITILALALSFKGCHSHVHDDHNHDHEVHHHNHVERRFLKQNAAKPAKVKGNAPTLPTTVNSNSTAGEKFQCGFQTPSKKDLAQVEKDLSGMGDINTQDTVTVSVYFHNIHSSNVGYMNSYQMVRQLDILNERFAQAGFHFTLMGWGNYNRPDWFDVNIGNGEPEVTKDMKRQLHRGDESTLNIYSVRLASGVLGYAYYPGTSFWFANPGLDGVVVDYNTVLGTGITGVHEVGHWLGLLHTFEGGCNSLSRNGGDLVADTPAESGPHWDCDYSRDSCPSLPGVDPVNNLMSYSSCRATFTLGQKSRMLGHWYLYRVPSFGSIR